MFSRNVTFATAGSAGSATGTGTTAVPPCKLIGVYVDFVEGAATGDLTITNLGRNVLIITNSATDKWYPVRELASDGAGAATTTYVAAVCNGPITVSIAQADPANPGVNVTLYFET